jgi:MYXO-CTERM domain-containing protein
VALLRASEELVVLEQTLQEDQDVLEVQADPVDPGLYLWRARACDEVGCSPWATSELFSLDAPADPNGDDDPDDEDPIVDVGVSPESGCACGLTSGAGSPSGGLALLALAGLWAATRRRRPAG